MKNNSLHIFFIAQLFYDTTRRLLHSVVKKCQMQPNLTNQLIFQIKSCFPMTCLKADTGSKNGLHIQCVPLIWDAVLSSKNNPYRRKNLNRTTLPAFKTSTDSKPGLHSLKIGLHSLENKPYIRILHHISEIIYCIKGHSVRDYPKINLIAGKTI